MCVHSSSFVNTLFLGVREPNPPSSAVYCLPMRVRERECVPNVTLCFGLINSFRNNKSIAQVALSAVD